MENNLNLDLLLESFIGVFESNSQQEAMYNLDVSLESALINEDAPREDLEAVAEAATGKASGKLKAAIDKFVEWLKGIVNKFVTAFKTLRMKGSEIIEKYGKEIATAIKENPGFKYKGKEIKDYDIASAKTAFIQATVKLSEGPQILADLKDETSKLVGEAKELSLPSFDQIKTILTTDSTNVIKGLEEQLSKMMFALIGTNEKMPNGDATKLIPIFRQTLPIVLKNILDSMTVEHNQILKAVKTLLGTSKATKGKTQKEKDEATKESFIIDCGEFVMESAITGELTTIDEECIPDEYVQEGAIGNWLRLGILNNALETFFVSTSKKLKGNKVKTQADKDKLLKKIKDKAASLQGSAEFTEKHGKLIHTIFGVSNLLMGNLPGAGVSVLNYKLNPKQIDATIAALKECKEQVEAIKIGKDGKRVVKESVVGLLDGFEAML